MIVGDRILSQQVGPDAAFQQFPSFKVGPPRMAGMPSDRVQVQEGPTLSRSGTMVSYPPADSSAPQWLGSNDIGLPLAPVAAVAPGMYT